MCLIDSGATLSVVHPSLIARIQGLHTLTIEEHEGCLRMADGNNIDIKGKVLLDLHLGGCHAIKHTFFIADVEAPLVIGMDFLEYHHGIIDIGAKTLTLNGFIFPCKLDDDFPNSIRVITTETQTVPPRSEMIFMGHLQEPPHFTTGLLRPTERDLEQGLFLVAKVVTHTVDDIPIRVINLDDSPRVLHQGQVAALCEVAPEVIPLDDSKPKEELDNSQLPEYLEQLFADSSEELEDDTQLDAVRSLLSKYSYAFASGREDLGRTNIVKHKILTGDARPIKEPPRRLPLVKREALSQEIQNMLNMGVIEESVSPWGAPVVLVPRKDKRWRVCLDFRALNKCTLRDSYPLPRIDDSLDALGGASWFSTLDLASGYYQVELDEGDKEKTAFVTHEGVFQFNVMPFGLTSAPATFEQLMERVLAGLHWSICVVYLDDIICFGSNFEDHLRNLGMVIDRIAQAGLKISPKKCQLFRRKVSFLGHVVSEEGITTDPQKVAAVSEWPRPANLRQVRSFLGFCSYYRKFIEGFARIAKPLHTLTEKDQKFIWSTECEQAFQMLKDRLIRAPVLGYPQETGDFILDCDASGTGIGAVLSQVQDGEERVLAYYSRVLSRPEQRYCVTRRELLAVVAGVKHFHHYVYGQPLLVRTDHGALRWLLNFKNPEGQVARWIEILQTYDLTIEYRPGTQHRNADGLSRRPCGSCPHCEKQEERDQKRQELLGQGPEVAFCGRIAAQKTAPWVESWTPEQLRAWQLEYPTLCDVIKWKEREEKPIWQHMKGAGPMLRIFWLQWETLELRNGVLYVKPSGNQKQAKSRLVAPPHIRTLILEYLHTHRTAGHLGIKKTQDNVRRRFWWPGLKKDVARWCRVCEQCQRRNLRNGRKKRLLQHEPVGAPMERMAMDILTFKEETDQGNTCVLVISDYFTKWVEAFAMPNHTAITVADVLVTEVFTRIGLPLVLHSDQGQEFQSQLMEELYKLLEIGRTRTAPYHAQSDGLLERFNRTLIAMLSKLCAENKET